MALWLKEEGEDRDVVVSTRVRLARNINKMPFPHRIVGTSREEEVIEAGKKAFASLNGFEFYRMRELDSQQKERMVAQHLISPALTEKPQAAVYLSQDQQLSLMMLEEDHFRIQCIQPGKQLEKTLKIAQEMDRMLNRSVEYAYHEKWGYLTSCPTNVGTGMRMSVMLHLPALKWSRALEPLFQAIGKFGLTARGIYGEGSEALGDMYQISNQVTLGVSEQNIVENLASIAQKIIDQERQTREKLIAQRKTDLEDQVFRAYGILRYAKKIDTAEAMRLLSILNVGVGVGSITNMTSNQIYNLMMDIMPAMFGRGSSSEERDEKRAILIQNKIKRGE